MNLSIIIPIYNAEKYLRKCLESVAECPTKEMECILVNDGSTDTSETICQHYIEKDYRFRLINKLNGGVSSARNIGIKAAFGKYIMFLDADDYMNEAAWISINDCIIKQKYDFIAYSYYLLREKAPSKEEPFAIEKSECTDMDKIRELLLTSSSLNTCWAKLYSLGIMISHNIEFREDLKIGEDFLFVADYFHQCTSAMLWNIPVLYYRQHAASAMHNFDLERRLQDTDILFTYNKATVLAYNDQQLLSNMYIYYLKVLTNLMREASKRSKLNRLKEDYKKALQKECIKEILTLADCSKLPLYKRIEAILLKRNSYLLLAGYFKVKSCYLR